MIVTPQHRLSLMLKQAEHNVPSVGFEDAGFVNVLDESDALLSHEFQLVYALGTPQDLPNGPSRWKVLQAFLLILCRNKANNIVSILDNKKAYQEPTRFGSFSNLRLLLPFHDDEDNERQLGLALCIELLSDPPYDFRWMKQIGTGKQELLKIMSDPSHDNVLGSIRANSLFERNQGDILAVRGFIAFGALFHGLGARYRVNYGLLNDKADVKLAVSHWLDC